MKRLNIQGAKSARVSAWAALGLAGLALAGCSNKDITALKAETLNDHPSFTIGQAFDHRNACKSVTWTEFKDDRGRKVITYRCHFKVHPNRWSQDTAASATQTFQWAKSSDGFTLIFAGRKVRQTDGSSHTYADQDPTFFINAVASDKSNDYHTYITEVETAEGVAVWNSL